MPVRCAAILPPVSGSSLAVQTQEFYGNDPLEGIPLLQEIVAALTTPLGQSYCTHNIPTVTTSSGTVVPGETYSGPAPGSVVQPTYMPPDTQDNMVAYWNSQDLTDYRPVIMPTQDAVNAMLAGSTRGASPQTVFKTVSGLPGFGRAITIQKAAIYSVMAGATPAMFPACLAMINTGGVPYGNSTTSFSAFTMITGDARFTLGINSGGDAFSPSSYAADVLGRVAVIASKNVGMHVKNVTPVPLAPQPGHFCSLGSPAHYEMLVFADNQEGYPAGWLDRNAENTTATPNSGPGSSYLYAGTGWTNIVAQSNVTAGGEPPQEVMADYMGVTSFQTSVSVYMSPSCAAILHDVYGFTDKQSLLNYFPANVTMTARQFWGCGVIETFDYNLVRAGSEPWTTYANLIQNGQPETLIKPYTASASFRVYVVGGGTAATWHIYEGALGTGVNIDSYD